MQFQTVRQTAMSRYGTVRVCGWGVGEEAVRPRGRLENRRYGASHQPGDWPVKRDIINDRHRAVPSYLKRHPCWQDNRYWSGCRSNRRHSGCSLWPRSSDWSDGCWNRICIAGHADFVLKARTKLLNVEIRPQWCPNGGTTNGSSSLCEAFI